MRFSSSQRRVFAVSETASARRRHELQAHPHSAGTRSVGRAEQGAPAVVLAHWARERRVVVVLGGQPSRSQCGSGLLRVLNRACARALRAAVRRPGRAGPAASAARLFCLVRAHAGERKEETWPVGLVFAEDGDVGRRARHQGGRQPLVRHQSGTVCTGTLVGTAATRAMVQWPCSAHMGAGRGG